MADEIKLKIVLDDGSVKEGFLSVEKNADQTAKKIGKSFDKKDTGINAIVSSADRLTDSLETAGQGVGAIASRFAATLGPMGAVAAAVGAVGAALGKAALAGEQVNAVNIQFDRIAKSAGLSVDSFKESIVSATQGLIDDEDALQIATKGIISLGDEAKRLPQILDASRSVSKALGKDFKESFQDLSTFVEFGNARVLRNYGIVLDLDKAYEKAAKSIGLTAAQLTEQQKQTIRANELLDQIPKKFNAAAGSVTPLKDAIDKLKVSISNTFENIEVQISGPVSTAVTRIISSIDDLISRGQTLKSAFFFLSGAGTTAFLAEAISGTNKYALSIDDLKKKAADTQNEIAKLNAVTSILNETKASTTDKTLISKIDAEIESVAIKSKSASQELRSLYKVISEKSGVDQTNGSVLDEQRKQKPSGGLDRTGDQNRLIFEERIKKEQELTTFLFNEQLKRINSDIQLQQTALANETSFDSQKQISASILSKQLEAQKIQENINLLAVDKQFGDQKLLSEQEKQAAINAVTQSGEDAKTLIVKKAEQDRIKLKKAADQAAISATSSALGTIATLQENATGELAEIGKAAALTKATIDGYVAVQNALASVPYPFNFAAAALVGVAAAANVAKIAKTGGGGSGGANFDTGGGIAASPSTTTELTPTENLQRQEPQTAVSVTIQGDVLDSDESGSRIVSLINQAFDKKGVVINQGVMA